jgi:pimeloyl-[acyl-carrier protein] methyl ester esterase
MRGTMKTFWWQSHFKGFQLSPIGYKPEARGGIKNNSKKLILFFNGWGMDANPFKNFISDEYDVLIFYDYTNFFVDKNTINEVNRYDEIIIISWSIGVYAGCEAVKYFKKPSLAIAINGTLTPVDDLYGIPAKIFNFTLKTLSEKTITAFYKNMFKKDSEFEKFLTTKPDRTVSEQKAELECIGCHCERPTGAWQSQNRSPLRLLRRFTPRNDVLCQDALENIYDFAIIGVEDKIFSAENQKNFWKTTKTSTILINEGHYPFYCWKNWDDIINLCGS